MNSVKPPQQLNNMNFGMAFIRRKDPNKLPPEALLIIQRTNRHSMGQPVSGEQSRNIELISSNQYISEQTADKPTSVYSGWGVTELEQHQLQVLMEQKRDNEVHTFIQKGTERARDRQLQLKLAKRHPAKQRPLREGLKMLYKGISTGVTFVRSLWLGRSSTRTK